MISIVTPSFRQSPFLEAAMQSVLTQGVDVEYVVVDGGSDDGSREIIERHASRLKAWVSEPDGGQYDAINKGFASTTGEVMAWLNADDFYFPGCLSLVEETFAQHPEIEWLVGTFASTANARGHVLRARVVNRFSRVAFLRGYNLPTPGSHSGYFIPQESVFWRRSLWDRSGAHVDARLEMAGDFDLWARFYAHAELWGVRGFMGVYRSHPEQKTSQAFERYIAEGESVLARHGGARYQDRARKARARTGGHLSSARLWMLPERVRESLVERGLLYRSRELVWNDRVGDWIVNTEYFV